MYTVTFKCDSCDGTGGWGGIHTRERNSLEEAEALVKDLKAAGDAYDIEVALEADCRAPP